jgi:hypothetical protein
VLRGFAGEREGRDGDGVDAGGLGVNLDFGNAGDKERRPDDDRKLVGSGVAFGVDGGAADVGVRGRGEEKGETGEQSEEPGARRQEVVRRSQVGEWASVAGADSQNGSEAVDDGTFGMRYGWNCVENAAGKAFATCYGVNLAAGLSGVLVGVVEM